MSLIKFHTDWSFKPQENSPPAFLLYGACDEIATSNQTLSDKSEFRDTHRFAGLKEVWKHNFQLVHLPSEADYAVLPTDWKHYVRTGSETLGREFILSMTKEGKSTVVLYNDDDEQPLMFSDIDPLPIVIRTSFNASKRLPNEFAMPGFVGDGVLAYADGILQIREKSVRPVVGFCGLTSSHAMSPGEHERFLVIMRSDGMQAVMQKRALPPTYSLRKTALDALEKSDKVVAQFILREKYCAGATLTQDDLRLTQVRRDFFDNLFNSDYVLCVRGRGNYSYRFYETLASGRIPVFVNTDSPLPLPHDINWADHCVILEPSAIPTIDSIIAQHYNALSPEEFEALQVKNRALWEKFLTPAGFFTKFFNDLRIRKISEDDL